MESVIKNAMINHLITKNLIKDTQHGFMPGRSCATNLISFLESVTEAKDNAKSVDVIYLDFSKAFDKVPHKRLSVKLRAKGGEYRNHEVDRRLARPKKTGCEVWRRNVRGG